MSPPKRKNEPLSPDRLLNVTETVERVAADQKTILDRVFRNKPALDERDLIERVLPLANANVSIEEAWVAIDSYDLSHGFVRKVPESLEALPSLRNSTIRYLKDNADMHDWFYDALSAITAKKRSAIKALRLQLGELLDSFLIIPRIDWTGTRLKRDDVHIALKPVGALAYVLMLLLDDERGLGRTLRQCKLAGCGRFFLSVSSGGRPRTYCSREHQLQYAAASGAERTARYRKKKAKKRHGK